MSNRYDPKEHIKQINNQYKKQLKKQKNLRTGGKKVTLIEFLNSEDE